MYILARGRGLILSSVAHLRKKAELKVVGVLEVRTWSGAGVSVLVCTHFSSRLHAPHVLIWYIRGN